MEKIVFECELVTPMFMYGEDGKTPELRPASIKGVMRFWWRAMHGNLSLGELREKESKIFGSTDKKSSFSIKIDSLDKIEKGKEIPKGFKFNIIVFKFSNYFDIENFIKLISHLALFGGKNKGTYKTQGSFKILKMNSNIYNEYVDINFLYELLKIFTSNYNNTNFRIERQYSKVSYPQIKDISISKNRDLYINFKNSKLKTIKKDLGEYDVR